ncbi:MAG: helix-turn-helix domain-containing protein [Oscillospiraceae bacterium]|nr:helix-turn-helix domain-containing protein [Oscillospiraceae bacterium]
MNTKDNRTQETTPYQTEGRRFAVGRTDIAPYGCTARRLHEEIEFMFFAPQGGGGAWLKLLVEDKEFILREGEALLIPPNLSHMAEWTGDGPCAYKTVCFHPLMFSGKGYRRFMQPLLLDGKAFVLKLNGDAEWQRDALEVLAKMTHYCNMPGVDSWELEFHGLIFILWSIIYKNAYADTPAILAYQELYKKMLGPLEYIHQNYREDIKEEVLAEQGNMAVGTFYRYFKRLMGITPFRYLSKYRILQSRALLVNTDKMISEIASLCGYNNLSPFNREFKKYMGVTPSEYRRGGVSVGDETRYS